MGTSYSLLAKEKNTWGHHCLLFDENTRKTNSKQIDDFFPDDGQIRLANRNVGVGGLYYKQFFITDMNGEHFLELSNLEPMSYDRLYETFRVQFNTLPHGNFTVCGEAKDITPAIKERMTQMLGMCNYSLCLRNSEHVANYIFIGHWASLQMEGRGDLLDYFHNKMTEAERKKINMFPSTIRPKTIGGSSDSGAKLYSMVDKQYVPIKFQYFADDGTDSYNILVVGK